MKLVDLARELKITTETFIKFIQDFDLELSECIDTSFEVRADFARFARENLSFLRKYEQDLNAKKSIDDIAQKINQPTKAVADLITKEKRRVYDNGMYRSTVSSYGLDNKLGGDYTFVYNYFGKKTTLGERDFIGYRDLFFYISSALEPFLVKDTLTDWGIHKPAGIVIYGPPGSGKIFWANKIAEIIGYSFKEIRKYYFGTSFVDGSRTHFRDFLAEMMKEEKVLLFMQDFDQVMRFRTGEASVDSCDEETKEIILHTINTFEDDQLLMVGSANSLRVVDKEVLAPGRFDVLVPVFPPNAKERAEMIVYFMLENLTENSVLFQILKQNSADKIPFWQETAAKMRAFSNTMILDFTQALKKKLRDRYLKDRVNSRQIDQKLLDAALREAAINLTSEYLNQLSDFLEDLRVNNGDDFPARIDSLEEELQHYRVVEVPRQPIGFPHQQEEKK